jgi:hypothetical protein
VQAIGLHHNFSNQASRQVRGGTDDRFLSSVTQPALDYRHYYLGMTDHEKQWSVPPVQAIACTTTSQIKLLVKSEVGQTIVSCRLLQSRRLTIAITWA